MEKESNISLGGAILYPNEREKHRQQNVSVRDKGVLFIYILVLKRGKIGGGGEEGIS